MSYLRELIEHGIMLVSCNKDILRLSVGGSIELLIHSFFIHSIYSSDSHLSHSTPFTKKVRDSRLKYNEKFKTKYNGDSKFKWNQCYKVYTFHSLYVYIKKKEEKKREVENKVKIDKGSSHKRTKSPWVSNVSNPALFSLLY